MDDLYLYGTVGASWWDEAYFTAAQVREFLDAHPGDVRVHLNSGGGIATEGQAIYALLTAHPGKVHVVVDAIAASAASLIAMAGEEISMREGAVMLVHDPASPWTEGRGTEADHLRQAAQLAVLSKAYAAVYARRTHLSVEECRAIMRDETLMDPVMAVDLGFATSIDAGKQAEALATFDYSIYAHGRELSARAKAPVRMQHDKLAVMAMMAGLPGVFQKEPDMADKTNPAGVPADDKTTATVMIHAPEPSADVVAAERTRAAKITSAVQMAGLPLTMATDLIERGTSTEEALTKVLQARAEKPEAISAQTPSQTIRITADARDKFREGAAMGLLARAGMGGERNEFSGLTLSEMAREALMLNGFSSRGPSRLDMVGQAFTMDAGQHSTSDFSSILANVAYKSLLKGWDSAAETFTQWTSKGTLTDFKATRRVNTGLFSDLNAIDEGAEYTAGTIGDRGETVTLATYGKLFAITRQAIINDDLGALTNVPVKMGRAAKRTLGNLAYAVLTGNPAMSDSVALFHATHANLAGTGAAPSVASFNAMLAAMATQVEATGGSPLNIRPKYVLAPFALKATLDQLLYSSVDPAATKGHAMNPVQNLVEPIYDARLDANSATAHYLVADPSMYDTVEVSYLDGRDTPYFEQQNGWNRDGVEMKVRIDAVAAPLDWRTMYKQPGA